MIAVLWKTGVKTHFSNLMWLHVTFYLETHLDMMEIFSVGLANKLMGIFKTNLIFCLKVIQFTQSFSGALCKFLVAGSSSLHFYTSFLD